MDLNEVLELDLVPGAVLRPVKSDLRVGLVGAGRIVHGEIMPAYRALQLEPVAACDPDEGAREMMRDRWGVENVFEDYRAMIESVDLDVVDINMAWEGDLSVARVEVVEYAAAEGIHVFIAKPLAETWEQCTQIVEAAVRGKVKFAMDLNTRYAPSIFGCRKLISSGALGELISASVDYHSGIGRQHTNAFDAVHDNCVHGIDILLSWFEEVPISVFGNRSRQVDGIGSVLSATFTFENGANARMIYDWASRNRRLFGFSAVGDLAGVNGLLDQELPPEARLLRASLLYGPHDPRGASLELPLRYSMSPDSFATTRADFFHAIEDDSEAWACGESALRTHRVLFALEQSIRDGVPVSPLDI
jgi:predicted dehydrogenase